MGSGAFGGAIVVHSFVYFLANRYHQIEFLIYFGKMWVILSKNIDVYILIYRTQSYKCIYIKRGQTVTVMNKFVDALYISENLIKMFDF